LKGRTIRQSAIGRIALEQEEENQERSHHN
jgi:hypothetical protein